MLRVEIILAPGALTSATRELLKQKKLPDDFRGPVFKNANSLEYRGSFVVVHAPDEHGKLTEYAYSANHVTRVKTQSV